MMDVFGSVDRMGMDGNCVNFLFHNVGDSNFIVNLIRMGDFDLFHNWNFNNFDFRNLFRVVLVVGVVRIFSMNIFPAKK